MTQIQVRRGLASGEDSWNSVNPTLASGEIGFETDTNRLKVGTGSAWNSTNYLRMGGTLTFNSNHFELSAGSGYDGTASTALSIKSSNTIVAGSSTVLATARKINGTAFDGSADVVIGGAIYGTTVNASSGTFTKIYASPLASPPTSPQLGDVWISW